MAEVAKFLNREFDYSRSQASDERPEQIRIRVYPSRQQLREEQRFLDQALGDLQPPAVTCGVIKVEVKADHLPDAQAVEQDHARELKQALSMEYHC